MILTKSPKPGAKKQSWPLSTKLPCSPLDTAPGVIRGHVRVVLGEWGMPEAAEAAVIIASELVTNVVRRATGPDGKTVRIADEQLPEFWFGMSSDRVQLLIRVWDPFPESPAPAVALGDDESGRGLLIVAALTNGKWGYLPAEENPPGGKIVWASLMPPFDFGLPR